MRLLTHNMLQCNVKKCTRGYPLNLEDIKYQVQDVEYNREFLERLLPKIDWTAFQTTLCALEWTPRPQTPPIYQHDPVSDEPGTVPYVEDDETWWHLLHEYILNRKITHAKMTCSSCQHIFPIRDGIPNMLVREDENMP